MENTNPIEGQQETTTPVVITASMIFNMLKSGKDRATIIKELKLSVADAKVIFSAPSLRGIKVAKPSNIQFIDDLTQQATENTEEVVVEGNTPEEVVEGENSPEENTSIETTEEEVVTNSPWGQSAE